MCNEFPSYLAFKERTYAIIGYIGEVGKYIDNKGYVDKETDQIYICSNKEEPLHNDVPILYVREDKIEKEECGNPVTSSVFNIKNSYNLSVTNIIENTTGEEVLYNEEALRDMNAATSIFVPTINEDDDSLKKLIKQIIISKQIDINRLKHKMPQKYGLTNMKSALVGKTKMSIQNFNIWCELLGVDFEFIITDNGTDTQNPLYGSIHYVSNQNKIIETRK